MGSILKTFGAALIGALAVAALVFGLAYSQEQVWNNVISLGPDWIVAGGMATLAGVVVFVSVLRD